MQQIRFLCLALVAGLAAALPVAATETASPVLSRAGEQLALEALEQRLLMPAPDWLAAGAEIDPNAPETLLEADAQEVSLLLYPRAESEAFWTTRVGARLSLDGNANLKAYRDVVIIGYAQICRPELTAFFQLSPDQGEELAPLGFACGGYNDRLSGYQGKGEVMIMRFLKTARGVGVVYQEWLGPAFDPATPASWPVDTALIERRVAQFEAEVALGLVD